MKVLKSTLKANGISYQITSGGYVRSISGLAEFDCGQGSGWMYKVNGVLPNVSCKSYKLTNGDKIEFRFLHVTSVMMFDFTIKARVTSFHRGFRFLSIVLLTKCKFR